MKAISTSHGIGPWILVGIGVAVAMLAAFSPIIAGLILLCCYSLIGFNARTPRIIVSLMFALVVSIVYASRQTFLSPFDDFSNVYYQWYLQIQSGGVLEFLHDRFAASVHISEFEIGTPLVLALIGLLPWTLSINSVIFCVTFIGGVAYIYWIEAYFLPDLQPEKRNCACVLAIGLFAFGLCSQTLRQMWSIPILLCALWERRSGRKAFLCLAAGLFHESSLVIALLGWLVATSKHISTVLIISVLAVAALYSSKLQGVVADSDVRVIDKAQYYTQIHHDAAPIDLKYLPVIACVAFIGLFAWRYRRAWLSKLILVNLAIYILLLPLPLASYRTTLFITSSLIGPVVALALAPRIKPRLMMFISVMLALSMLARRAFIVDSSTGMALWDKFPAESDVPFYYADVLFSANPKT